MSGVISAGMWGGLAAGSLLIGAGLTLRWTLSERLTGAIMGFGAGALISSIGTSWCRSRWFTAAAGE